MDTFELSASDSGGLAWIDMDMDENIEMQSDDSSDDGESNVIDNLLDQLNDTSDPESESDKNMSQWEWYYCGWYWRNFWWWRWSVDDDPVFALDNLDSDPHTYDQMCDVLMNNPQETHRFQGGGGIMWQGMGSYGRGSGHVAGGECMWQGLWHLAMGGMGTCGRVWGHVAGVWVGVGACGRGGYMKKLQMSKSQICWLWMRFIKILTWHNEVHTPWDQIWSHIWWSLKTFKNLIKYVLEHFWWSSYFTLKLTSLCVNLIVSN